MFDELEEGNVLIIFELQTLISVNIGSNPKTIDNAIRTAGMCGLIKDIGNSRFEVKRSG